MAVKVYKKNTAGRRNMSIVNSSMGTDKKPEKSLLAKKKSRAGRSKGKISGRHQGGGHKQRYRLVDFLQNKLGIFGKVVAIERDPSRSAFIALVNYEDGDK
ncbi:MAG TPA: 50S ribosomal protein L2, partial [Candidatus Moranbacteria bacterium]|nr:50S ribosomal protein L2 [Candidatus Moranbacteria bacterium]